MSTSHNDDPLIDELVRELNILVQVGAWPAAIATRLEQLGLIVMLADPDGQQNHYGEPHAIVEYLTETLFRLDPNEESPNVQALRHLFGISRQMYWQKLHVRRSRAAKEVDRSLYTWRNEYEGELLVGVAWEMVG